MTATPPEPHVPAQGLPGQGLPGQGFPVQPFPVQPFPVQPDLGPAAGQLGSAHARQRLVSRLPVWQIVISLIKPVLWTGAAVIILVGGILELTIDNVPGAVVCVIVGGLAVWFAYRSCTRWARRFLS
jgi:hypothetical protein